MANPSPATIVDKALAEHKPMWAFMAHWETGSGRINDIKGFSEACLKHGVMGIVDAASSLGVADFSIDDYPGVVAWGSCPQKGVLSPAIDLCTSQLHRIRRSICEEARAATPMCTIRSWRRGIGASSTARTLPPRPITARIPVMRWRRSTRRCASSWPTGGTVKPRTTPITRKRCARLWRPWAATSSPIRPV